MKKSVAREGSPTWEVAVAFDRLLRTLEGAEGTHGRILLWAGKWKVEIELERRVA